MTEIFAVRPRGNGTTIHLYSPGYQPGKKKRNPAEAAMCNGGHIVHHKLVPLADALGWSQEAHEHDDGCGHARWTWCRPCLGHGAVLAGAADETATVIGMRLQPARGAP